MAISPRGSRARRLPCRTDRGRRRPHRTRELVHRVPAGRDTDRARADAHAAGDVGRRVADDDEIGPGDRKPERALGAPARDLRKLVPLVVVGPERADDEARRIDADGGELGVRAVADVAR
jgi:hypothetical protein